MQDVASLLQTLPGFLTIVNVVILLSAVFFFTSTLASHLLEMFVGIINSRGKQLRKRLETALGENVAATIYDDPLIRSLMSRGGTVMPGGQSPQPPSYIEPELFARVVARLSRTSGSAVSDSDVIKTIKESVAAATPAEFEPRIVEWFRAVNDRQNGVYTRWSFLRLLIIGVLFAAAMDIDTVHITGTIWKNPEMAENVAKELGQAAQLSKSGDLSQLTDEQRKKLQEAIASAWTQLRDAAPPAYAWQTPPSKLSPGQWASKLLGWLLTALATSLGAQFWFNIMSEALKLRAAGRKPDDDVKKSGQGQDDQG
jgi:hypothetical protein